MISETKETMKFIEKVRRTHRVLEIMKKRELFLINLKLKRESLIKNSDCQYK